MDQPCSGEVVVLRLHASGTRCSITLEDGATGTDFELAFEDAGGIRLLVGSDDLTRWLMKKGQLWALRQIRSMLESAAGGQMPTLPHRLRDYTEDVPTDG